ncbi:MAG: ABC transporter ATP-binding protein [Gemmatimonadota bacterium]|nr:MAG: ABC transporter ATP-binding protein [Gemmatimonadota bacterium]
MDKPAISIRGLTRRFDDLVAVRDLSLDVASGELLGLVGPDGAGKTTTLRMLAGVLPPSEGDAIVLGQSIATRPEAMKSDIAYMSQRFGLYQDLTVRENIEFYADLYAVPRVDLPDRIERLYAFSRLGPFERRLAGDLSGGMKQKLGLCCALVHRPRLLLLDEPTFGVDPISRRDLWLIIHERIAGGTTAIVSTAYMEEAERCDRVAFLHEGRLVGLDEPRALQGSLGADVVELEVDRPRQALVELARSPLVRSATPFGDSLRLVLRREADWSAVRAALEAAGLRIARADAARPSLEDVFVELVRRMDEARP